MLTYNQFYTDLIIEGASGKEAYATCLLILNSSYIEVVTAE